MQDIESISLYRTGISVSLIGVSLVMSVVPGMIHESSYRLFDIAKIVCCSSLFALGSVFHFTRAFDILEHYNIHVVTVIVSSSFTSMLLIDILFAKLFDACIEEVSNQCKHSRLAEAFEYSSLSNVELHDFTNTNIDNICIEEGREDWEVDDDEDVVVDSMYDNEDRTQLKDIRSTNLRTHNGSGSSYSNSANIGSEGDVEYSPFLATLFLLSLTVCNSIGDGIILTLNSTNDTHSLGSVYFRQIITSFSFGTVMEMLNCNSVLFCLVTLCYSLAIPAGILIGSTYREIESTVPQAEQLFYKNNSIFNGFISALYTGVMVYFSVFHMLPKDLLSPKINRNVKYTDKILNCIVFLCIYTCVVIGIVKNPMRV